MVQGELDTELWVLMPVFTIGAAISLGLIPETLMGFDVGQTLFSYQGIDIGIGRAMSIAALVGIVVNRDSGIGTFTDFSGIEAWAIYVTLGLVLVPPFLPVVEGTVVEQPWAAVSLAAQTIGFSIISYSN